MLDLYSKKTYTTDQRHFSLIAPDVLDLGKKEVPYIHNLAHDFFGGFSDSKH